jgi:hypothetical protein
MNDWITWRYDSSSEESDDDIYIYKHPIRKTISVCSPHLSQLYYINHDSKNLDYHLWDYKYIKYHNHCVASSLTNVLKFDFGLLETTIIKLNEAIHYLECLEWSYKLKLFVDEFLFYDIYIYMLKLIIQHLSPHFKYIINF